LSGGRGLTRRASCSGKFRWPYNPIERCGGRNYTARVSEGNPSAVSEQQVDVSEAGAAHAGAQDLEARSGRQKSLLDKYGEQLLCVRYHYDEERHLRHTTVEWAVETVPYRLPTPAINRIVGVRVFMLCC
jgi:hypothetical protein